MIFGQNTARHVAIKNEKVGVLALGYVNGLVRYQSSLSDKTTADF
jgi:alanine racemase